MDDPAGFQIVAPLEVGGTTDARRVTVKAYITSDEPGQRNYISVIDLDWKSRKGQLLGDVSTTEVGRRIYTPPLSKQQLKTIAATKTSLYFIARLEYCDIRDNCYYFMRCAEIGDTGFVQALVYCGTRSGSLERG